MSSTSESKSRLWRVEVCVEMVVEADDKHEAAAMAKRSVPDAQAELDFASTHVANLKDTWMPDGWCEGITPYGGERSIGETLAAEDAQEATNE